MGLPALGGFLFSCPAMNALADCELSNATLLDAVRSLAFMQDGRHPSRSGLSESSLGGTGQYLRKPARTAPADQYGCGDVRVDGGERERAQDHGQLLRAEQSDPGADQFGAGTSYR